MQFPQQQQMQFPQTQQHMGMQGMNPMMGQMNMGMGMGQPMGGANMANMAAMGAFNQTMQQMNYHP